MSLSLSTAAISPRVKTTFANKLFGIDMTGVFPLGSLTGTPAVTCISATQTYATGGAVLPGDLTIAAPIVNVATFPNSDGFTVQIGFGVQVRISGGIDGGDYVLQVSASDGSDTDGGFCTLQVRNK